MAPGRKTAGDVGFEADDHHPRRRGAAENQHQLGKVTGAQKGDHNESHKEDQRRTEVPHNPEGGKADPGKDHIQREVSLFEEFVEGSGTGKNEGQLHQFRRLHRKTADGHPVPRAVGDLPQQKVQRQSDDTQDDQGNAHFFTAIQILQKPADEQEKPKAHHHGDKLLVKGSLRRRGTDAESQRRQEKGNGLHFKGHPFQSPHGKVIDPHHNGQQKETDRGGGRAIGAVSRHKLDSRHKLEDRQQEQGAPRRFGTGEEQAAFHILPPFLGGHRHQFEIRTADGQRIHKGDRRFFRYRFAVNERTAFGTEIMKKPYAFLVADQRTVITGDRGDGNDDIGAFGAADHIFPMGQGHFGTVGETQCRPDLRGVFRLKQRADDFQ